MRRVVIGMGSQLNRDDDIGNLVAKRVGGIAAGKSLENVLPQGADEVVLIDAVLFGGEPGEVRETSVDSTQDFFHSTHSIPLSLIKELNPRARVRLIAIQPKSTEMGESLTPQLKRKLPEIVREVTALLSPRTSSPSTRARTPRST